jgi:beta-phosphoglucomutase family hydrolase
MNTKIAVIFDMNGVIIDDAKYHDKAWFAFCDKYNISISIEEMKKNIHGKMNKDIFPHLFGRPLNIETLSLYEAEKEGLYRELYKPDLKATSGFMDFIEDLKRNNVKMAIATSSYPENANFVLEGLEIKDLFDAVIDSSQVIKGKPNPEIFLTAAAAINAPTQICVGFEDSLSGLAALNAAKIKAVGVASNHSIEELTPHSKYVIKDFRGLTYKTLLSI